MTGSARTTRGPFGSARRAISAEQSLKGARTIALESLRAYPAPPGRYICSFNRAISRRARDRCRADGAARAGTIDDDELLAEPARSGILGLRKQSLLVEELVEGLAAVDVALPFFILQSPACVEKQARCHAADVEGGVGVRGVDESTNSRGSEGIRRLHRLSGPSVHLTNSPHRLVEPVERRADTSARP